MKKIWQEYQQQEKRVDNMQMQKNIVKCPYCGESYYRELCSSSTCMHFPPVYKDGVNINPDRNVRRVNCRCLNCNEKFSYKNQ